MTTPSKLFSYQPSEWKKCPDIAKARMEFAQMYRAARKENPKMAVLLRNRINSAYEETRDIIVRSLFTEGNIK